MPHDHQLCIDTAIASAEAICQQQGLRFTPIRQRVLRIIWENHQAIKAYDILEQLQQLDKSAKPPTAYRALEFLLQHGFIHRIESLNAYIGCPHPEHTHHFQLLICENCGTVKEMDEPDLSTLVEDKVSKHNFRIQQQVIEVHGLCASCA
ncbi:MAG: transcriptional repressor [Gammaproteobacteria bacterium]